MPNIILALTVLMMSVCSGFLFYSNSKLKDELSYNRNHIFFINGKNEVQLLHPLEPDDFESLIKAEDLRISFIESFLTGLLEVSNDDEKIQRTIETLKRLSPEVWQQHADEINTMIDMARTNELKQTIRILATSADETEQGAYYIKYAGIKSVRGEQEKFIQKVRIKLKWIGYTKNLQPPFEVTQLQFTKKEHKI